MGKFATFVAGGLIGAAAAYLLSPRAGEDNRKVVAEKIVDTCPAAAQLPGKANQIIDVVASTSTKVINTVVDKGQDIYNNATRPQTITVAAPESIPEKNDELRQKIDAARERIATQVAKNAEAVHDAAVDKVPAVVDAAGAAAGAVKDAVSNAAATITNK